MHLIPVTVWPAENGPAGPGRPVEVRGELVGIAESWADIDELLERAGVPKAAAVWRWIGGASDVWE